MERGLVFVGRVVRPHGIRGDLKTVPYTDEPEQFKQFKSVFVEKSGENGKWFEIEKVRFQQKGIILKLSGVDDRNDAETFRGSVLRVRASVLPEPVLSENSLLRIVGFSVISSSGENIGRVEDVLQTSAQNVLVVNCGGKEILIPAVDAFLTEINLMEGMIVIDPIDGLLDGDAD